RDVPGAGHQRLVPMPITPCLAIGAHIFSEDVANLECSGAWTSSFDCRRSALSEPVSHRAVALEDLSSVDHDRVEGRQITDVRPAQRVWISQPEFSASEDRICEHRTAEVAVFEHRVGQVAAPEADTLEVMMCEC